MQDNTLSLFVSFDFWEQCNSSIELLQQLNFRLQEWNKWLNHKLKIPIYPEIWSLVYKHLWLLWIIIKQNFPNISKNNKVNLCRRLIYETRVENQVQPRETQAKSLHTCLLTTTITAVWVAVRQVHRKWFDERLKYYFLIHQMSERWNIIKIWMIWL